MKCKCIKKETWFLIDDSFGEDDIDGGEFSFEIDNIYECEFIKYGLGDYYNIKIKNTSIGFTITHFKKSFILI